MSQKTPLLVGTLAVILLLFIPRGHSSPRPAAPGEVPFADSPQALHTLLGEVRELRLALQKVSLSTYRNQTTIERLRLQEQRVDDLRQRLEQIHEEGTNADFQAPRVRARLKALEDQLEQEKDPSARAQLLSEYEGVKGMLEEQAQQESLRRQKESRLTEQLQAEQDRAAALNERLNAIEREMENELEERLPQKQR